MKDEVFVAADGPTAASGGRWGRFVVRRRGRLAAVLLLLLVVAAGAYTVLEWRWT
jgi:hypothetical protein